jgi:hypothetical protein
MSSRQGLLWVFIPLQDGRLRRHPEVYETFAEAQEAFQRHTGVEWMESFCAAKQSSEGFYPGELAEGPSRGSRIYPAILRTPAALRRLA